MKRIILFVAFCLSVGNLFAQDADKLRDAGDAALKAKNYPEAVAKYSEYLKLNNYKDTVRIFNCGFSASQAKKYAEAAKFFEMAVKNNYKLDNSYVGAAMAYRNLKDTDKFLTTVESGLKALPNNANLEKLLYSYCIKNGQIAQKKGDIDLAEKLYKGVLLASNKKYKEGALYSLGAMFYNKGAMALQKATPLAVSSPDKYKAEKAKASEVLNKAKEYLNQALTLNAANANVKKLIDSIAATLK